MMLRKGRILEGYMREKFLTVFLTSILAVTVAACGSDTTNESADSEAITQSETNEEASTEESDNGDTEDSTTADKNYHVGDEFTLEISSTRTGEYRGELTYTVTDTGVTRVNDINNYVYVCVDIENTSNEQFDGIIFPDFYADGYLLTDDNPDTFDDETSEDISIKPGKKLAAKFYHYIDDPFGHDTVEADFGDVAVMIIDNSSTVRDSNGNIIYEGGKLTGDPNEISGWFYDESSNSLLSVQWTEPDLYHITLTSQDGSVMEGDSGCSLIDVSTDSNKSYAWQLEFTPNGTGIDKFRINYYRNLDYYVAFIWPNGSDEFVNYEYPRCDADTYASVLDKINAGEYSDTESSSDNETETDNNSSAVSGEYSDDDIGRMALNYARDVYGDTTYTEYLTTRNTDDGVVDVQLYSSELDEVGYEFLVNYETLQGEEFSQGMRVGSVDFSQYNY